MKKVLLALTMVAAVAVQAQDSRFALPEEPPSHGDVFAMVGCAFEQQLPAERAFEEMLRLRDEILSRNLVWVFEAPLERMANKAFASTDDPMLLAAKALDRPELRDLGLEFVRISDGALASPYIREELLRLLAGEDTSLHDRVVIVGVFSSQGRFDAIRETALALVSDHKKPIVAHAIAEAVVTGLRRDDGATAELEKSPVRALREEFLRRDYACEGEAVVTKLLTIAKDEDEAPMFRCGAIATLANCTERADSQAALLELLDRSRWFSCAPEQTGATRSVDLIVQGLAGIDAPLIRARLLAMHGDFLSLPDDEREYLENLVSARR